MLRNYFVAAIRNLFRNRAYAAINICGLALGFTAAILIGLFVRDELSYDRQWPEHERIFSMHREIKKAQPVSLATVRANFARAMELDFPEIEFATRLTASGGTLRQRNLEVASEIFWADSNFFRMFPPRVVAGDAGSALTRPDALVVTRRFARQLFNRENVIGEAVQLNGQQTLYIAAVIENLPSNSHFNFDVIAPGIAAFSPLSKLDALAANEVQPEPVYTYVRLRPGADVRKVNALMPSFAQRHATERIGGEPAWKLYDLSLVALPDIHFLPPGPTDMKPPADRSTLQALSVIGLLILFVAASNFVSMMSARSASRAIEVGVRKAVGATRRQIIVQFLGECLFYSGLALGIAIAAAEVGLPGFNGFLQKEIAFDYVREPMLGAAIVTAWLVVGLAAGAYPALILSMFRPVTVLKGVVSLPGGVGRLRHAMVVLQFGTLIALIVSTITIHRQTRFAIEDQLRVRGDQMYVMQGGCVMGFRDVAAKVPGVRDVSCTSDAALAMDAYATSFVLRNGGSLNLQGAMVDAAFFRISGIEPTAGRLFDEQHGEDNVLREAGITANPSIILNESAARALGYANPREAVGQVRRWSRVTRQNVGFRILEPQGSDVVGVVPDVALGSIRNAIAPMAYYIDPSMTSTLVLKLDGSTIPETMGALQAAWAKVTDGPPFAGRFMSQIINDLYADILRQRQLSAAFSAIAIVVASLGLLGLAVFTAQRRTREIGLRKAMGASRWDILRFISWKFVWPVLLANLLAWPCAGFFMRRWLDGFAYRVDLGPFTFLAASGLALLIALITVSSHALLVARSRPTEALRYE